MPITIDPDALRALRGQVEAVTRAVGAPKPILQEFGRTTLRWIDDTFAAGGRPKWAPLAPWTLAGRREGKGRGGPQPLQNIGTLRSSFDILLVNDSKVEVGTPNPIAVFHEYVSGRPLVAFA